MPMGCFYWRVNDEMYSVGGSIAHSRGVMTMEGAPPVF